MIIICIHIYLYIHHHIPSYSNVLSSWYHILSLQPHSHARQTESCSAQHPAACAVGAAAGVFLRWNPRLDGAHGPGGAYGGRGGWWLMLGYGEWWFWQSNLLELGMKSWAKRILKQRYLSLCSFLRWLIWDVDQEPQSEAHSEAAPAEDPQDEGNLNEDAGDEGG